MKTGTKRKKKKLWSKDNLDRRRKKLKIYREKLKKSLKKSRTSCSRTKRRKMRMTMKRKVVILPDLMMKTVMKVSRRRARMKCPSKISNNNSRKVTLMMTSKRQKSKIS